MAELMQQDRDRAYAVFAQKQEQSEALLAHNALLLKECDELRAIIGALVLDLGGEVLIPLSRLDPPHMIDIQQSGVGRDDELTITVMYDA